MKRLTGYFHCLFVAALAVLTPARAQDIQPPFSITISAESNVFKAGSQVTIRLLFKNISGGEIPYTRNPGTGVEERGEFFTDVHVRGSKGELIPETIYYRRLRGKDKDDTSKAAPKASGGAAATPEHSEMRRIFLGSFTGHMLKPGETREEEIVVSKLYDLSQPGQYTISASRRLSDVTTDPNGRFVAKSNTLMITITR